MNDVKVLALTMLVVVAHADVGALGDDVGELSGVGVHACVIGGIHQVVVVLIERRCKGIAELVRRTASHALMTDDAVDTTAVKGNGTIELLE